MSGVVLRCPNCGTIGPIEGQCEACHEADVRYFCTNHEPGLWLEASACPQCGARFGDPVSAPPEPARTATPRAVPPERRAPPTTPRTVSDEPSPWETSAPFERGRGRADPSGVDPFRILLGTMISAARARSRAAEPLGHDDRVPARPAGGCCFGRLLFLAFVLLLLFMLAPMILGVLLGFR